MLMSGLFGENLFDDFWGFPSHELANIDKRLYGKNSDRLMKTDVQETENDYELEIDLPGFKKDQINVKLEEGYMTISASKGHDVEKKDKEIEDLIAERQEARKAKNFARADEIRDELLAKGIILKDTREGVVWEKI